jgi:hypothetical protein
VELDKRAYSYGYGRNQEFSIEPEKMDSVNLGMSTSAKKLNKGIKKISVFTESGNLWMVFKDKELNNYAVPKENTIDDILEHQESWPKFRLEIHEEYMGIGLKKGTNFEEEIEDENDEDEIEEIDQIEDVQLEDEKEEHFES